MSASACLFQAALAGYDPAVKSLLVLCHKGGSAPPSDGLDSSNVTQESAPAAVREALDALTHLQRLVAQDRERLLRLMALERASVLLANLCDAQQCFYHRLFVKSASALIEELPLQTSNNLYVETSNRSKKRARKSRRRDVELVEASDTSSAPSSATASDSNTGASGEVHETGEVENLNSDDDSSTKVRSAVLAWTRGLDYDDDEIFDFKEDWDQLLASGTPASAKKSSSSAAATEAECVSKDLYVSFIVHQFGEIQEGTLQAVHAAAENPEAPEVVYSFFDFVQYMHQFESVQDHGAHQPGSRSRAEDARDYVWESATSTLGGEGDLITPTSPSDDPARAAECGHAFYLGHDDTETPLHRTLRGWLQELTAGGPQATLEHWPSTQEQFHGIFDAAVAPRMQQRFKVAREHDLLRRIHCPVPTSEHHDAASCYDVGVFRVDLECDTLWLQLAPLLADGVFLYGFDFYPVLNNEPGRRHVPGATSKLTVSYCAVVQLPPPQTSTATTSTKNAGEWVYIPVEAVLWSDFEFHSMLDPSLSELRSTLRTLSGFGRQAMHDRLIAFGEQVKSSKRRSKTTPSNPKQKSADSETWSQDEMDQVEQEWFASLIPTLEDWKALLPLDSALAERAHQLYWQELGLMPRRAEDMDGDMDQYDTLIRHINAKSASSSSRRKRRTSNSKSTSKNRDDNDNEAGGGGSGAAEAEGWLDEAVWQRFKVSARQVELPFGVANYASMTLLPCTIGDLVTDTEASIDATLQLPEHYRTDLARAMIPLDEVPNSSSSSSSSGGASSRHGSTKLAAVKLSEGRMVVARKPRLYAPLFRGERYAHMEGALAPVKYISLFAQAQNGAWKYFPRRIIFDALDINANVSLSFSDPEFGSDEDEEDDDEEVGEEWSPATEDDNGHASASRDAASNCLIQ